MKRFYRCSVLVGMLLLLIGTVGYAAEIEVYGEGPDQASAVANALSEAIRQVKGVQINSETLIGQLASSSSTRINKDGDLSQLDMDHLQAGQSGSTELKSQGLVSRYRILDVRQGQNGGVTVHLAVEVADYHTPGLPMTRRRLAVLPFKMAQGVRVHLPIALPPDEIVRRLTHQIINQFTQSRRFAVLERDFGSAFQKEEQLLLETHAPVAEIARLGNVLGADYLVVGRVKSLYIKPEQYKIATLNEVRTQWHAGGQLEYRIVTFANRQVKWSGDVAIRLSGKQLKALKNAADDTARIEILLAALGKELVNQAIQNIFPLRVIREEGSELVLNEGGVRVRPGDHYRVYQLGAQLKDPYTGEPLGRMEKPVGEVEVIRVLPKYSVAVWRKRTLQGPLGDAVLRQVNEVGHVRQENKKHVHSLPINNPSW